MQKRGGGQFGCSNLVQNHGENHDSKKYKYIVYTVIGDF